MITIETLKKMYKIHSPSHNEDDMQLFIMDKLDELGVTYQQDKMGNIFNFIEGTPLLSAHMDQVQTKRCHHVITVKSKQSTALYGCDNDGKLTGLGADDKNGLWIILNALSNPSLPPFSFLFSVEEEVGGNIDNLLKDNKELVESMPFALILDRRNGTDIIGTYNSYCESDFENDLEALSDELGFKFTTAMGIFSDADAICEYIPCVNLSVGYYAAHSTNEYTMVEELETTLKFTEKIIKELRNETYQTPTPFRCGTGFDWKGYQGINKNYYTTENDDDDEFFGDMIEITSYGVYLVRGLEMIDLGITDEEFPKGDDIKEIEIVDIPNRSLILYEESGYPTAAWLDEGSNIIEILDIYENI